MSYKFNPFTGNFDEAGPSVSALNVLGTVANEAALPGGATTGDVYQAEDTGVFYVWDGSAWDNLGTLVGPQGPTGATGATGPAGADGANGADGADGVGVVAGGTTNQVLAKASNADYDTQWVDQTGGGGTPGGSDGQIQFNDSGSFGGITGSSVDATGSITLSLAGASSTPPVSFTGSWFTGGTATTTKPQLLIEPTGTTSTAWSTDGTGLGVNAASGFSGNLLDLQLNGSSKFSVTSAGQVIIGSTLAYTQNTSFVQFGGVLSIKYNGASGSIFRGGVGISFSNPFSGTDFFIKPEATTGLVSFTDGSTGTGYVKQAPVLVSQLPAAATVGAGTRGFVSDATSTTFAAAPVGGGANTVPVYSDGTNWLIG